MNTQTLLAFINGPLLDIGDRARPEAAEAEADTELFESGIVDSLAIIHLIAFIEAQTEREIGHEMIVMKHFKTPRTIAETFFAA